MRGENLLACALTHPAPSWFFPPQSNPPEVHLFSRCPEETTQPTSSLNISETAYKTDDRNAPTFNLINSQIKREPSTIKSFSL